jgi:hypothetical protein
VYDRRGKMGSNWKSRPIQNGARALISKRATTNWRMMLIATSVVLGINFAAFRATAQLPEIPDPSRVNTGLACPASSGPLGHGPGPFEVFIYPNTGFGGQCALLQTGLYPHSWTLGLPDDSIRSIEIGAGVRARLFRVARYGGTELTLSGRNAFPNLGSFSAETSSMRVELAERDPGCRIGDLRSGEIALYTDPFFNGDCIVLPAFGPDGQPNNFPTSEYLGIANDAISSIVTAHSCDLEAFQNEFFTGARFIFRKGAIYPTLPSLNNSISSIRFVNCTTG